VNRQNVSEPRRAVISKFDLRISDVNVPINTLHVAPRRERRPADLGPKTTQTMPSALDRPERSMYNTLSFRPAPGEQRYPQDFGLTGAFSGLFG
jgi:hypothetical protein